jgi:hypothetical protein
LRYIQDVAPRSALGCLLLLGLALAACGKDKDSKNESAATPTASDDLAKRCMQLAKLCGDSDKHVQKIADECKQVVPQQGCMDKLLASYDCYEKELCGKNEKVWSLDDLRVLTERHGKCAAERKAARECAAK